MVRAGGRPEWAVRLRRAREERNWTQESVVRAMRTVADGPLPEDLLTTYKRYERGRHFPTTYAPLLAAVYGTDVDSLFGPRNRTSSTAREMHDQWPAGETGMSTQEIVAHLNRSAISDTVVTAIDVAAEQLCCDYRHIAAADLLDICREWLARITRILDGRLTLSQHGRMLAIAGQFALLVGCLEFDIGQTEAAEATRLAAMELGRAAGSAHVIGWAYEQQAWFALTRGAHRDAITAARAGHAAAPTLSVAAQLAAQEARAWARLGDRDQATAALTRGRALLDALPRPEFPEHHFVVDTATFEFLAMDCYRHIGEHGLAAGTATEVIRHGTASNGTERTPMRISEARLTLAVVATRDGDLDGAVTHGLRALAQPRRSRPSLLMVAGELATELRHRFPGEPRADDFHRALDELRGPM